MLAQHPGPEIVRVGRVTAVYWPGHAVLAASLAELADRPGSWPGLPPAIPGGPLRLIVADTDARFDSVAGGRAPAWSGALAFPASSTILLRATGDPRRVLRHELAHLALHDAVTRVPRWFDEGYAAMAAGEWGRLEVLQVNWALARGEVLSFDRLNAALAGRAAEANDGYALAMSAVLLLQRLGGERGLEPLLTAWQASRDLDQALRTTHALSETMLEQMWQRDLRQRYGWLQLLSSLGLFWTGVALLLGAAWYWRRRRDRARRLALDEGWVVEEDFPPTVPPGGDRPSA